MHSRLLCLINVCLMILIGHGSCTGSDCDHMCLSLSSRYYQCVCPDSLNDTSCTEDSKFMNSNDFTAVMQRERESEKIMSIFHCSTFCI